MADGRRTDTGGENRVKRFICFVILMSLIGSASFAAPARTFTQWGWPQPYDQVSQKSIDWLKSKGYWPLSVAWTGPWSGEDSIATTMEHMQLLQKRGIDAKYTEYIGGPPINESMLAGRSQVGFEGNFPFTTLLVKQFPVVDLAVLSPNLEHCTIVPNDSTYKSLKDWANQKTPLSVGVLIGSSPEFYFQDAARVNGVVVGKDVTLVNMPVADEITMPRGIAGVVPWEPTCTFMADYLKTGRIMDTSFAYSMYEGNYYVTADVVKNAPDVAQALTDAFMEATLYIRYHPDEVVDWLSVDPMLKHFPKALLAQQQFNYNNLYKPTAAYPFPRYWATENARISAFLYKNKTVTRLLTAQDYFVAWDPHYMDATFKKLGWKVPETPPWIPKNWPGRIGYPPYPTYYNVATLKKAQPWPEKGDLTAAWQFEGKTYHP
jgi:sulfonate transport system substrate-binding protein